MSIRPIDMQVIIPRATEVGAQQNNLAQQGVVQQQQFAEQMAKAVEVRQKQVQGVVKDQGGKVQRDGNKEKNHKSQADDTCETSSALSMEVAESETETQSQDPVLGHIIDIKT